MDFNKSFPISAGFPQLKIHKVSHWYDYYYEFELAGEAHAVNFTAFFDQLVDYNEETFGKGVQKMRENKPDHYATYKLRLVMANYNDAFLDGLAYFLQQIQSQIKPTLILFGGKQTQLIDLLESLEVEYKSKTEADAQIEKIEWYWAGMHPNASPRIRFDKVVGHCVAFGPAIGTPLYPNHREPLINWFEDYLSQAGEHGFIQIDFLFDYFDMIDNELRTWVDLLAEKFQPNQLGFTWYFNDEDVEIEEEEIESLNELFEPFQIAAYVLPWEEFDSYQELHYHRFQDI